MGEPKATGLESLGDSGIAWIGRKELLAALSVAEAADALREALRDPDGLPQAPLLLNLGELDKLLDSAPDGPAGGWSGPST